MLSFDENGWLFPNPLNNIIHDIDVTGINDLLKNWLRKKIIGLRA